MNILVVLNFDLDTSLIRYIHWKNAVDKKRPKLENARVMQIKLKFYV